MKVFLDLEVKSLRFHETQNSFIGSWRRQSSISVNGIELHSFGLRLTYNLCSLCSLLLTIGTLLEVLASSLFSAHDVRF